MFAIVIYINLTYIDSAILRIIKRVKKVKVQKNRKYDKFSKKLFIIIYYTNLIYRYNNFVIFEIVRVKKFEKKFKSI